MRLPPRERLLLAAVLLFAAGVFFTGIDWGLPSRRADPFLFGDRTPWTGEQIQALTKSAREQWDDPNRAADVAAGAPAPDASRNHAGPGALSLRRWSRPEVNATDAQRAQIVRRYRLFTYQPDEMITLMSLARMHPGHGDLDPRLYQYGGLWIYPVGALLKVASLLHLVQLHSGPEGLAFYLDHPEAFGKFYVVARLYSAAWGLVAVWAVYQIVRRLTRLTRLTGATGATGSATNPGSATENGTEPVVARGAAGPAAAVAAAVLFALMPVTVNMAHEAKPHLPGAALVLLAVLAGGRYVRHGRWRDALAAGGLCGAAFGMVLSMLPAFSLLPLMALLRPATWLRRLGVTLAAAAVGVGVYAATNPYVVLHQFWRHEVLQSNLQNSAAMYHVGSPVEGAIKAISLMAAGMTPPLAFAGWVGAVALGWRALLLRNDRSEAEVARRSVGLLLAGPALLIAAQAALVGAGKPAEFGRFLLVPDAFLLIEAVVAVSTFLRRPDDRRERRLKSWAAPVARSAVMATLLVFAAWGGFVYLRGFVADSQPVTPRLRDAELLRLMLRSGQARKLAVAADPAPYCLPPVDLFRWQIIKIPDLTPTPPGKPPRVPGGGAGAGSDVGADVVVLPVDRPAEGPALFAAPISWAAKPFEIRIPGALQGLGPVPVPAEP